MWRLLLFELVLVVVVAGVWLLAPLVGIRSVFWRIMIILGLVLPPILMIIWNFLKARKAASGIEKEIRDQGKAHEERARPDRKGEIQELNEAFNKAVTSLKKSKLSGKRGAALYALPWYMIIGPPAAGKSTALLRSGLKFPFSSTSAGDGGAIKGVGGTRNCDWWFSDQAILLDTAGRYTSEDDDQEEWIAFLRMLRRYRKRRPLNGLLVAVSAADLLTGKPEDLEALAAKIRGRVDQVIKELDLALPVYVLITKCDLISGFVQFFGDLEKSTRSQVLGFTVPLTTPRTNVEQLFLEEYDLLTARVHQWMLTRLARAKAPLRGEIYRFPLELTAARGNLATFVAQLMVTNPYLEMPRLRGVYLCSGTQEGKPVEVVLGAMTRALGLRELDTPGLVQKSAKKSYFLRDVFTKVIFPDQEIAGTTAAGQRRRRRLGIAALAAAVLLAAGAVGAYAVTFSNNRTLINSSVDVSRKSRITTPEDPRKVLDSLQALDKLRENLDQLERNAAQGPPWSQGLGFYKGDGLLRPVEQIYIRRMRRAFVLQAGSELEATLTDIAATAEAGTGAVGAAEDFDLLKTYLMVTDHKRLEVGFAANVLLTQWKKRLHPEVAQERELLLRNARRYLGLIKAKRASWLERDEQVVQSVRHALRARDVRYRVLIGDLEGKLPAYTLRDALRGQVQTAIKSTASVPGIYTRAGWTSYLRKRIAKQMIRSAGAEPWVLGEEGKAVGSMLRDRYYEQYIGAWRRFLKGLSVEPATTAQESVQMLEKLADHPSILVDLFGAIAYNTELPLVDADGGEKVLKDVGRHLRGKAGRTIRQAQYYGLDRAAGGMIKRGAKNKVEQTFWPLRELVHPPVGIDGQPQISGLQQYLSRLMAIRDALAQEIGDGAPVEPGGVDKAVEEARRITTGILATIPGDLRRLISPLLFAPLEVTSSTAKTAQSNRAAGVFSNELCTIYRDRLAGKYPFARSKRDALLDDAVEFFSPKGTVWTNFDANFKHLVARKGDRFAPLPDKKVNKQIVSFFNRAWRITQALFPMGQQTPQLRVQVRPQPAVLATGAAYQISEIVLEIDGVTRTYRNGPIEQWSFSWTGSGKRSRVVIRGAGGLREELSNDGDWALQHLIDGGRVSKRGSWYRVEWSFRGGKITIPIDFRPARTYNALFMPMELNCR